MKSAILTLLLAASLAPAFAQRYMSRTGRVTFFSVTPVENIQAINNETACALNAATGDMQFIVPVKSFKFEKALMEEHFNENYMESDKFPKGEFRGRIANMPAVSMSKDGAYPVQVAGKLTIHGVTRDVTIPGTLTVKNGAVTSDSKFSIHCADYGIKIPSVVSAKVAEEIKITVSAMMTAAR